tara:strand:+ start:475 stop:915 length:441 start_codon:yes stop_codon:yes gene_type:complete
MSTVSNISPDGKSLVFTDNCYKHFNKGCPPGKDNQSVKNCGLCIANNMGKWSDTMNNRPNPNAQDKQILKDCQGNLTQDLLSAGMYCSGAEPEVNNDTTWRTCCVIVLILFILLVLLLCIRLSPSTSGGMNSRWYGGFAEEPMREM